MTRNPGRPLPDPSDPAGHRQQIVAIEYTISTTMPGKISLPALEHFAEQIIDAIEFLRGPDVRCKNKNTATVWLERAKIPLQVAIDEASPSGNKKKRYQNITSVGEHLREVLRYW